MCNRQVDLFDTAVLLHGPYVENGRAILRGALLYVRLATAGEPAPVLDFDLPHSNACFVRVYPTKDTESFLDGHVAAFAFLDGVPQSILRLNKPQA